MVGAVGLLGLLAACVTPARNGEFINLFDGKTMNGWTLMAKHGDGYGVKDGILYCTTSPCLMCTKMIINAGLSEVVYEHEYHFSEQAKALFKEAGVICRQFIREGRNG